MAQCVQRSVTKWRLVRPRLFTVCPIESEKDTHQDQGTGDGQTDAQGKTSGSSEPLEHCKRVRGLPHCILYGWKGDTRLREYPGSYEATP
jgi:hypothetical protein